MIRAWLAMLIIVCPTVFAGPLYEARTQHGVLITVYSEVCTLKAVVVNLPRRVTWTEGDKVYEGCAQYRPDYQLVILYFEDKTIGLIPAAAFKQVTGA